MRKKRLFIPAGMVTAVFAIGMAAVPTVRPGPVEPCRIPHDPARGSIDRGDDSERRPILGMTWRRGRPYLARLDPLTLEAYGTPTIRVGTVAALSPDGSEVVSARGGDYVPEGGPMRLRFVDVGEMDVGSDVTLGRGGGVHSIDWFADGRLIVVTGNPARAFIVDATKRAVVGEIALSARNVYRVRRARSSVVVLTSSETGSAISTDYDNSWDSDLGPTRVHVVHTDGLARSTPRLRIRGGFRVVEDVGGHYRHPGLAVDAAGDRAFVVGRGEPVAEIDLSSMDVGYHDLGRRSSLLGRLLSALSGIAEAKGPVSGPTTHAEYLPSGHLVIWGHEGIRRRAAGVTLIELRNWSSCVLNGDMSDVAVGDEVLVAWDGIASRGRSARARSSSGVVGYDFEGAKTFELLNDTPVCWVDVVGGRAYVYRCGSGVAVIDLDGGRIIREVRPEREVQLITAEMRY